jgi:signal transduction histidine kinase
MPHQLRERAELNLYRHKNAIKFVVGFIAITIVSVSGYYNNFVVSKLKERERQSIQLFADGIQFLADQGDGANLTFVNENIVKANTTVPLILATENGEPTGAYLNLDIPAGLTEAELDGFLRQEIADMREEVAPIPVVYRNLAGEVELTEYVYYRNSDLLRQLNYYPLIQLGTILLFAGLAYLAFSFSRTAEQNRVWVGLAKETAHQLGTPLSSLMAWLEYLKSDERTQQHEALPEMDKDIEKLLLITERFSNIGSVPQLEYASVEELVQNTVAYLRPRISTKVSMDVTTVGKEHRARVNAHLFSWVIENIIKNAVDAMSGVGSINIRIAPTTGGYIAVDIKDSGPGIAKKNVRRVFQPGFTTKQRGWGLGLTLAKRIIQQYHQGRIFVKQSGPGGTTFRVMVQG